MREEELRGEEVTEMEGALHRWLHLILVTDGEVAMSGITAELNKGRFQKDVLLEA